MKYLIQISETSEWRIVDDQNKECDTLYWNPRWFNNTFAVTGRLSNETYVPYQVKTYLPAGVPSQRKERQ